MINNYIDTPELIEKIIKGSPFIAACNLELISHDAKSGKIVLRMPFLPNFARDSQSKQFHGGAIASLIDTAGDFAVAIMLGGAVPTINLRIDYMRPAMGIYVEAHAVTRRLGRTISIVDIDLYDDAKKLAAIGRGVYSSVRG